jgi:molybdate transport system permease protein
VCAASLASKQAALPQSGRGAGGEGLSADDLTALRLTIELALVTTALLLLIGTPIAWWLARTRSRLQPVLAAVVAMPLVLPPTVLGFYLLLLLGPHGAIGRLTGALGLQTLAFSFSGLVLASVVYSLPFVVQPLQAAFFSVGEATLEAAASLRAGPWDRFISVAIPLAAPGFLAAIVLGFAHVVGEFGIVLMIGGDIPGATRVLSVAIYDRVEAMDYTGAGRLAGGLLVFSFAVVLAMHWLGPAGAALPGRAARR